MFLMSIFLATFFPQAALKLDQLDYKIEKSVNNNFFFSNIFISTIAYYLNNGNVGDKFEQTFSLLS
jgi:hypothetical protein